jgi:hypothetical protein
MTSMNKLVPKLFLLLGVIISQPACSDMPKRYAAEAIEARVIDAETNQPLEGVIVTANWELEEGTLGGNVPVGQLMVMEAVTDKNGHFNFSAWGLKKPSKGGLRNKDPQLLFFKSEYHFRRLVNEFHDHMYEEPLRRSDWNGKTIEMKFFKGTGEEYVRHLSFLMTSLRFIEEECQWKKTPRMLMALQKQAETFKASGIVTAIYSIEYLPTDEKECGSVKEYFREYRK